MLAKAAQVRLSVVADAVKAKTLLLAVLSAVAFWISAAQVVSPQPDGELIRVTGNTVVAFFPPVSEKEMEDNPDLNEALSDFQLYTSKVGERLAKEGIQFHVLYVRWFRIGVENTVTNFHPHKVNVGYYFIAPGKSPRIEYGVTMDDDLVRMAHEYFRSSSK